MDNNIEENIKQNTSVILENVIEEDNNENTEEQITNIEDNKSEKLSNTEIRSNINTENDINNTNISEKSSNTENYNIEKTKTTKTQSNGENAFIISGTNQDNNNIFISEITDNKYVKWTENLLEAETFLENELEDTLFLLKSLYYDEVVIKNIEIRKFYWTKYNSLHKYFNDLNMKIENIKQKMTNEEYEFLIKYKDKL